MLRYVPLNKNKTPSRRLSDGGLEYEEVHFYEDIGVLIPEPYVVLDFDITLEAYKLLKIVEYLDLKCLVMKTSRGLHFWFKSEVPWKNFVKTRLRIGLTADCRSWGKLSYTVVKQRGEWREWIRTYPHEEVEMIPPWLSPLTESTNGGFVGMRDGDGRNQALFNYILTLQSRGLDKKEIGLTLELINRFVFDEPLSSFEMSKILRDESFKDEDEVIGEMDNDIVVGGSEELDEETRAAVNACFTENGGFRHNVFARLVVENLNIITVNEQTYIYEDGFYQMADRIIEQEMVRLYPSIKRNQRLEVMEYIKIITHTPQCEVRQDEYIINLNNTRLDVVTREMLPFSPEAVDFSRVPVDYNPEAYSEDLVRTLNKVFMNDKDVLRLFEEMMGYMLIKNCRYRKGFIFYGGGKNGKSTILNMVKKFIGDDNCSTIELEKLNDKFKTAELENKLVNIGDDIDRNEIGETGTIKKLFTGESVTVERKNQQPFTLKSYAKLLFSCNEIPHIADKSAGMYSRLMLIPFNAVFESTDPDYDPFIEDKITTPTALSHLLNMALDGLARLISRNQFTEPNTVKQALGEYRVVNSNVLSWLEDARLTMDKVLGNPTDHLYSMFRDWCSRNGIRYAPSLRTFHKEIQEELSLDRKRVRDQNSDGGYGWVFTVK